MNRGEEKPHTCEVCNKTFAQKSNLRDHLQTHSGNKPNDLKARVYGNTKKADTPYTEPVKLGHLACETCQQTFSNFVDLKKHLFTHTKKDNHTCDICQKTFSLKADLTQHAMTHSEAVDLRTFSCEICQEAFSNFSALRSHLLTHPEEDSESSEDSPEEYAQSEDLGEHVMTRSGAGKAGAHTCLVCHKAFSSFSDLQNHLLTHTTEEKSSNRKAYQKAPTRRSEFKQSTHTEPVRLGNHVCETCQRVFSNFSELKNHLITHLEEKNHTCDVCQQSFSKKLDLIKHLVTHTAAAELKTHACEICQETFSTFSQLRKHLLSHPAEEDSDSSDDYSDPGDEMDED